MTEIIDIHTKKREIRNRKRAEKKALNGPDPDMITYGPDGTKYYKFAVNYAFKGKNWSFYIFAKSKREAQQRVSAIKRFPVEIDQMLSEVPA